METIARCYCGAVEVCFGSPPRGTVHCHCGQCRRQSGAAFTTWVSVPAPPVLRGGAKAVGAFSATRNTVRHFCRICGSHLYTVDARHPDIVGISAGAIVEPMHLVSTGHYFVDDKASWHEISDGLPQFGGRSGFESVGASSGGCSETMPSNSPSAIVQAQLDAYNAKDLEALLRTYAVDAEQFALNGERLARGHSELRTRFAVRLAEANIHARLLSRIVMGNVVTDHELVTRNFPEGRGSVEMLCIYEVLGGHIQKATFALGEKRLDADTRTKIQKGSA